MYIDIKPDCGWVDCCHPIAISKRPKAEPGDPAMVQFWTGDVPVSQISDIPECPTYEVQR
jgi:hypothetical protein